MKKISRKTAKALEKIAMSASYSLEYRGGIDDRRKKQRQRGLPGDQHQSLAGDAGAGIPPRQSRC